MYRQDMASSLILGRIDLRGFCLFILINSKWTIGKKNRSDTISCLYICIVIDQIFFSVPFIKLIRFLLPPFLHPIKWFSFFNVLSESISSSQNINGHFFCLIFVWWLFPCKVFRVEIMHSLQNSYPAFKGFESLSVCHM